jgi:hypothetical protein
MDGGFFRWEISDFEDAGKHWDVTFERASAYQFKIGAPRLDLAEVVKLRSRIEALDQALAIDAGDEARLAIKRTFARETKEAALWLSEKSEFFKANAVIDFQCRIGPASLRADFNRFMAAHGLAEIEQRTAEIQVLNPHSGDWIKAMQIAMAEVGLKAYKGSQTRSPGAFAGIGSRENRSKYVIARMAFLRAAFHKMNLSCAELYRGMSTEREWQADTPGQYRFWSSWTFNRKVAEYFSDFAPGSWQKNSYLLKRSIPVEKLFMTFLETDAMNQQYSEAEAIVLHDDSDRTLW